MVNVLSNSQNQFIKYAYSQMEQIIYNIGDGLAQWANDLQEYIKDVKCILKTERISIVRLTQSHLLLSGSNSISLANSLSKTLPGVTKIYTLPQTQLGEVVAIAAKQLIDRHKYKSVIGLNSSYGKDIIPRIAGMYTMQPISQVIEIIDPNTFLRPIYAGNAITKVQSEEQINFLTIRPSSFPELELGVGTAELEDLPNVEGCQTEFVREDKSNSNRPQLTTAKVVVSGGRGVKSKQNFQIIHQLAESLGDAAVGASRAAVDAGYCPNEMQVGQTGKIVAPELYFAVGISGAVQHLAGMKDSKVIVAINNRPDQPIFEVATYGLVADLFKAVPQLTQKLKKIKQ